MDDVVKRLARDLAEANPGAGGYEIRPVGIFHPSELG